MLKLLLLSTLLTMIFSFSALAADEGDSVVSDAIEPRAAKEWYFNNFTGQTGSSGFAYKADSEQTAYLRTTSAVYNQNYPIKFYTQIKNSANNVVCLPFTIYGITLYTTPYSGVWGVPGGSYAAYMTNQTGYSGPSSLTGTWTP